MRARASRQCHPLASLRRSGLCPSPWGRESQTERVADSTDQPDMCCCPTRTAHSSFQGRREKRCRKRSTPDSQPCIGSRLSGHDHRCNRHSTGRATNNPAVRRPSTRCSAQMPARNTSAGRDNRPALTIDCRRTSAISASVSSSCGPANSMSPIVARNQIENKRRTRDVPTTQRVGATRLQNIGYSPHRCGHATIAHATSLHLIGRRVCNADSPRYSDSIKDGS